MITYQLAFDALLQCHWNIKLSGNDTVPTVPYNPVIICQIINLPYTVQFFLVFVLIKKHFFLSYIMPSEAKKIFLIGMSSTHYNEVLTLP